MHHDIKASHLSKLVHFDTLGDEGASGREGVAAHHVDGRGEVLHPTLGGEALDCVPGNDGGDQDRDDGGVTETKVANHGDEDGLTNKVDDTADASVVRVFRQPPLVTGSDVVITYNMLAEERKVDDEHDAGVEKKVEPLVIRPLLEAGVEAVLDVTQTESIPSLHRTVFFLWINLARVPLQEKLVNKKN